MRNEKAILVSLIILNIVVVFTANYLILSGKWHYGKDQGFFPRMECAFISTPITYFILAKRLKFLFAIIGFITGYFSIIISMIIINRYTKLESIFYHLLSVFLVFIIFYFLQKARLIRKDE